MLGANPINADVQVTGAVDLGIGWDGLRRP
jgi:hypothetical protein